MCKNSKQLKNLFCDILTTLSGKLVLTGGQYSSLTQCNVLALEWSVVESYEAMSQLHALPSSSKLLYCTCGDHYGHSLTTVSLDQLLIHHRVSQPLPVHVNFHSVFFLLFPESTQVVYVAAFLPFNIARFQQRPITRIVIRKVAYLMCMYMLHKHAK